jgi:hypothetical protein
MSCLGGWDDFSATRVGTAGRIAFRDDCHYLEANRSHFGLLKGQPELQREFTSVMRRMVTVIVLKEVNTGENFSPPAV